MTECKRKFSMTVNGLVTEISYPQRTIDEVFLPLLRRWTALYQQKKRRILIYLSAPPGVGKSTTAQFLEEMSKQTAGIHPVQALGLDGFHFHQDYILTHTAYDGTREVPMQEIKGSPQTFDVEKLHRTLSALRTEDVMWPAYDRTLHGVVEDSIAVTGDILLLEGNWLLLDQGRWADLEAYSDDTVFIEANAALLEERLIRRKMQGGMDAQRARAFYLQSDRKNVERVLRCRRPAAVCLRMEEDGGYLPLLLQEKEGNK